MTLPPAEPRKSIHNRDIQCRGFARDDGLWDIEGHLVDTKSYSFANTDRGGISSGEAIHDIRVRLTVDSDLTVHDIQASIENGPYTICENICSAFQSIKGLSIKPGWRRDVLKRVGGIRGCTHITDLLLGPLAVTAWQTVGPAREKRSSVSDKGERPALLGTCHALKDNSPIVKRDWPDFYREED